MSRPTKRCARSRAFRCTASTSRSMRSRLTGCGHGVAELGRGGAPARAEDEGEGAVVADALDHLEGGGEVLLGLAREADDDVGRERDVGDGLAGSARRGRGSARGCRSGASPSGSAWSPTAAAGGCARRRPGTRRGRRSRPPSCPSGAGSCSESDRCRRSRRSPRRSSAKLSPVVAAQVAAVAVHVLSEQRDLADAVGRRGARTSASSSGAGPALLAPARRGHDAVGADAVAALRDLQPCLERALPPGGQMAGELLELEEALRAQRFAGQELGQLVDLAGAEGDVDEREAVEDLVLDRLRPAAADADDRAGPLGLEPLGLAEVGDEAVVGGLADRAGVEEDQLGVGARRRPPRSRARRACPSSARSRARSSGTRTSSRGSACRPRRSRSSRLEGSGDRGRGGASSCRCPSGTLAPATSSR